MGFVENICILAFYLVAVGVFALVCAGLLALLRRFAPDWLRNTELGRDLGLAPDDPDEITAADVMHWNARNVPANDNND
jgi:hypothetical protein